MSRLIQYSCPNCNHIISGYSKRGFTQLHTGVGLPVIVCKKCTTEISSGLEPFSKMDSNKKIGEIQKTSINIIVISLLFGIFLGGAVMYFFQYNGYSIHSIPFIDTSTEKGRLTGILLIWIISSLPLAIYRIYIYKKYYNWVEKQNDLGNVKIKSDEFNERYPDW